MLTKVDFAPGMSREGTSLSNEGSWYDGDKIRFRSGYVENIGGWEKSNTTAFSGTARFMLPFLTLDSENYMFIGTSEKAYLETSGVFNDITPIRSTDSLGTDAFTSDAAASGVVSVSHTSHGATVGSYVTISGATAFDGLTTGDLNKEQVITTVTDDNTYEFDTGGSATAGSVSGGGAAIQAEYQINIGLDSSVFGPGWGAGTWGRFTWNSASGDLAGQTLRLWYGDNFGEDVIFNVADEGVYYWDATGTVSTRAVELSTMSGASNAPTIARKVIVSDTDRHIIAFGCNALGESAQDPLLIRWSDSEDAVDWTPTTVNTAGDIRLSQGSEIITAIRTKRETLVWTDTSLHSLQFLGPPYTFGSSMIGDNVNLTGPNAVARVNDEVYWMGHDGFYKYDGTISVVPCPVRAFVFDDINKQQSFKITSGTIASHTEVWWFYCSADETENDRYVVYNYSENVWTFGSMVRTAWVDRGAGQRSYPQATGTDGFLYHHEKDLDDGSQDPVVNINSYVESADFDIGDGYQFMLIRRIIPDLTFNGSSAASPTVTYSISTKDYPGVAATETDSEAATRTASSPVELYTKTLPVRVRGRSASVKIENTTVGVKWRLGTTRLEVRGDGRR